MSEALLIIDYQNDFTPPDGALAVEGGDQIAQRLNREAADERHGLVVATRDRHPSDHRSFAEHGGEWPVHCVAGTEGAELDPRLERENLDVIVDKGEDRDRGGYSAFETGELAELLREHEVERVRIGGLATDVCVRQTALDAIEEGLEVEVLAGATEGVDPVDTDHTLFEIEDRGGTITG